MTNDRNQYTLRQPKKILQSFRLLAADGCMITGRFQTGKYSFLSTVIDVLADRNLLVLDYGPNEMVNRKLLEASLVAFSTRYRGVDVRFTSAGLEKKRYQGQPVFVTEIPDSVYWKENRQSYRIQLGVQNQLDCRIPVVSKDADLNGKVLKLRVVNLARGGVGLFLPHEQQMPVDVGTQMIDCTLVFPDGSELIDLEICHRTPVDPKDNERGSWVGCAFLKPSQRFESRIMRYMFEVERQQRSS